ncbi:NIPSNAP family protein [Caulobacter sp.]|uniref:NIPSNAP family protein n=1 Tax=Caulobacter sp. TaxID=78 RepID=UPI003BAAAA32
MTIPSPAVVELRQYTLHPGRRDALITLFEREFVESQQAAGVTLIGLFRDLDDPNRFVWLRGFTDMEQRRAALTAFYDGPVWAAHRDAANATMIDSDDVLLLQPHPMRAGAERPWTGGDRLLTLTVQTLDTALDVPDPGHPGAEILAAWVTNPAENTFPRLPVREGERVLVWMTAYADEAALAADEAGVSDAGVMQRLRLAPTGRSRVW